MIGGFLGTLIALEKIIPLKRKILYLIPVLSGGSIFLFIVGLGNYALLCLLIASFGLNVVFFIYWTRERSLIYLLMVVGAGCWLIGNILLLRTHFYPISISWWMAFVLLVITAERLELMKFLPVSQSKKNIFIALLILFLAGCVLSFHYNGNYLTGLALMGISVWLMKYDVIGINLKREGLVKYIGIALLSGYTALLLSGMLLIVLSEKSMGYDATLHSFFIGFVLAMIFAHGPIILPGVLGISLKPYHSFFYFWLLMLHLSWIIRTVADIGLNMEVRQYSGWASAIAIVGYFITLAFITIRSQREKVV